MKKYSIAVFLAAQALLACCFCTSCASGGENLQYAVAQVDPTAEPNVKLIGSAESKNIKKFVKDLYPGVSFPKGVEVTGYQVELADNSSAWYFVYTKDGKPVYAQKFPAKDFKLSMAFGQEAWAVTKAKLDNLK